MLLELAVVGGASHVVRRVRRKPRLIDYLTPSTKRDWTSLKQQTETMSEEERAARRYFLQTSVMLGSAVVGMVFNPTLLYLLIPGIVYTTYPLLRDASRDLIKKRRFTVIVMDVILSSLSLIYGVINPKMLALTTFSNWLYSFFLKVIAVSKSNEGNTLAHLHLTDPENVWVVQENVELAIPFKQLQSGDVLVVDAGQTVPVDGVVLGDVVKIEQYRLSGNNAWLERCVGDPIFAGSVLREGRLYLQVTDVGAQTALAQMRHVYENTATFATDFDLRGKALADRFALPGTIMGVMAYPVGGLDSVLAVMMLSPCYLMRLLGLLTIMEFMNAAVREGILIKDGRVLEQIHKVDTAVLDTSIGDWQQSILPVVRYFQDKGMTVWLVSTTAQNGLLPEPLDVMAQRLGITHYSVVDLPQERAEWVKNLEVEGHCVAYVGDGIHDAVPMKCATVSISLKGISTLANDTASIILLDQTLHHLPKLFDLSRHFERSMSRSLLSSTIPNVLGIAGTFAGVVTYTGSIGLFYSGMGIGLINVFWPQVRSRYATLMAGKTAQTLPAAPVPEDQSLSVQRIHS